MGVFRTVFVAVDYFGEFGDVLARVCVPLVAQEGAIRQGRPITRVRICHRKVRTVTLGRINPMEVRTSFKRSTLRLFHRNFVQLSVRGPKLVGAIRDRGRNGCSNCRDVGDPFHGESRTERTRVSSNYGQQGRCSEGLPPYEGGVARNVGVDCVLNDVTAKRCNFKGRVRACDRGRARRRCNREERGTARCTRGAFVIVARVSSVLDCVVDSGQVSKRGVDTALTLQGTVRNGSGSCTRRQVRPNVVRVTSVNDRAVPPFAQATYSFLMSRGRGQSWRGWNVECVAHRCHRSVMPYEVLVKDVDRLTWRAVSVFFRCRLRRDTSALLPKYVVPRNQRRANRCNRRRRLRRSTRRVYSACRRRCDEGNAKRRGTRQSLYRDYHARTGGYRGQGASRALLAPFVRLMRDSSRRNQRGRVRAADRANAVRFGVYRNCRYHRGYGLHTPTLNVRRGTCRRRTRGDRDQKRT